MSQSDASLRSISSKHASVASAASVTQGDEDEQGPYELTEQEKDIAGESTTAADRDRPSAPADIRRESVKRESKRQSQGQEPAHVTSTATDIASSEQLHVPDEELEGEANEPRQVKQENEGEAPTAADAANEGENAEKVEGKPETTEKETDQSKKDEVDNRRKTLMGEELLGQVKQALAEGGRQQKEPRPSRKSQVTEFEAPALSTVLEELYMQLDVLTRLNPAEYLKQEEKEFLSYEERFAKETGPADLDYVPKLKNFKNPFKADEAQIGTREERLALKTCRCIEGMQSAFLQEIIRLAKEEMDEGTFEAWKERVRREDELMREEITLMEREKKAKSNVKNLNKKIAEFRDRMERAEHNRKEMILHLKDQIFQVKQNAKMDARYARAWLEAKEEFNYSKLNHAAELEQARIKDLEIQAARDKLAHKNIEVWSVLHNKEVEGQLINWGFKFGEDVEAIDKKICDKQDTLCLQEAQIAKLNETIDGRMVELGPWEEEKERERQERLTNMRLFYSARKIQRWWRAFMVKHNLYKKKKRKKVGKGKNVKAVEPDKKDKPKTKKPKLKAPKPVTAPKPKPKPKPKLKKGKGKGKK